MRLKKRRPVRDDRHGVALSLGIRTTGTVDYWQKIGSRQVLGGENSIHRLKGQLAPAVQEIGNMRLPKTGLASQQRDTERPSLYPTQQFQA